MRSTEPGTRDERWLDLSSAAIGGGSPDDQLCVVCARSIVAATHVWTSYGCEACCALDRRIAESLGGKRFLALGRQALMNGFGLEVATSPSGLLRAAEVLDVQTALWSFQAEWCRREVSRLASVAGFSGRRVQWADWTARFPASAAASAESYGLLLRDHYGWVLEQEQPVWELVFLPGRPSPSD